MRLPPKKHDDWIEYNLAMPKWNWTGKVAAANVLTRAVPARLPPFDGQKVIYCVGCLLGRDRLQAERIVVRQTPCVVKVNWSHGCEEKTLRE